MQSTHEDSPQRLISGYGKKPTLAESLASIDRRARRRLVSELKRIGILSRDFKVVGDPDSKAHFASRAWQSQLLGAVRTAAYATCLVALMAQSAAALDNDENRAVLFNAVYDVSEQVGTIDRAFDGMLTALAEPTGTSGDLIVGDGSGGGGGGGGSGSGIGGDGGGDADTLTGTVGDDVIFGDGSGGGGGGSRVGNYPGVGGAGGGAADTIDGGDGNDIIFGDGFAGADGAEGASSTVGGDGGAGGFGGGGGGGGGSPPDGANYGGPGGNGGLGGGGGGGGDGGEGGVGGDGGDGGLGGGGGGTNDSSIVGLGGGFDATDGATVAEAGGGGGGGGYYGQGGVGGLLYAIQGGSGGVGGGNDGSSDGGEGGYGGGDYGTAPGGGGGGGPFTSLTAYYEAGYGGTDGATGGNAPAGNTIEVSMADDVSQTIFTYVSGMVDGGTLVSMAGGAGDDVIDGGPGSDHLFGMGGTNTFIFEVTDGSTSGDIDTIHDWANGLNNQVDVRINDESVDAATIEAFVASQTADGDDRLLMIEINGITSGLAIIGIGGDLVADDFTSGAANLQEYIDSVTVDDTTATSSSSGGCFINTIEEMK